MARMLGRYASGECGCADCSPPRGRHSGRLSSRWRKRIEQREAERQIAEEVAGRESNPDGAWSWHLFSLYRLSADRLTRDGSRLAMRSDIRRPRVAVPALA